MGLVFGRHRVPSRARQRFARLGVFLLLGSVAVAPACLPIAYPKNVQDPQPFAREVARYALDGDRVLVLPVWDDSACVGKYHGDFSVRDAYFMDGRDLPSAVERMGPHVQMVVTDVAPFGQTYEREIRGYVLVTDASLVVFLGDVAGTPDWGPYVVWAYGPELKRALLEQLQHDVGAVAPFCAGYTPVDDSELCRVEFHLSRDERDSIRKFLEQVPTHRFGDRSRNAQDYPNGLQRR